MIMLLFFLNIKTRHLKNLGFRIPLGIINKAHQANQIYPYAISLLEAISVYNKICTYVNQSEENTAVKF